MNKWIERLVRPIGIRVLLTKERLQSHAVFNPLDPMMRRNPYPTYRRLREQDPVHWSELLKGWVLTRYTDVAALLRDPRFSADGFKNGTQRTPNMTLDEMGPYAQWFSKTLLSIDPPDHTRLRGLVSKAFTPRSVEVLRPRIREIVDELLDAAEAKGSMDLIHDFAYPLPVIVIAEMLGVPPEDRTQFRRWSDDLGEGLEPVLSEEQIARANRSIMEIGDYFRGVIRERRAHPREDMISTLVAVEEAGEHLSEDELLATLVLLLAAGNETTTNLIGNGMLALLRHPDELRRLREQPELMESAVEELLRFDSPVQMTGRVALEDLEIGGKAVKKGTFVVTVLGAANRDPEQFPDPDRLDIGRSGPRHFSFGMGIHFCLGAPLARVEGQIALAELLRRFQGFRPEGRPEWRSTLLLHGLKTLPLSFTSAPRSTLVEPAAAAAGD